MSDTDAEELLAAARDTLAGGEDPSPMEVWVASHIDDVLTEDETSWNYRDLADLAMDELARNSHGARSFRVRQAQQYLVGVLEETSDAKRRVVTDGGVSDIVPDDFDAETLRERLQDYSETKEEERERCASCGSIQIRSKGSHRDNWQYDGDYYCGYCGASFDEPQPPTSEVQGR